jgi:hypothetical protein
MIEFVSSFVSPCLCELKCNCIELLDTAQNPLVGRTRRTLRLTSLGADGKHQ